MTNLEFFVPMKPPRTTHQMKQVRVVNRKPVFYEPAKLKAARGKLKAHLAKHRPSHKLGGPLRVVVKWLFYTKKKSDHGKYKVTRPDLDNMEKLLFDVMGDLGFWNDDAQLCSKITEKLLTNGTPGIWCSIRGIDDPV